MQRMASTSDSVSVSLENKPIHGEGHMEVPGILTNGLASDDQEMKSTNQELDRHNSDTSTVTDSSDRKWRNNETIKQLRLKTREFIGAIEQSEDDPQVLAAFDRLEMLRSEHKRLLRASTNLQKSVDKTSVCRKQLAQAFANTSMTDAFSHSCTKMAKSLDHIQTCEDKTMECFEKYVSLPLRGMLHNEISRAYEMKTQYVKTKRLFDYRSTAKKQLQDSLMRLQNGEPLHPETTMKGKLLNRVSTVLKNKPTPEDIRARLDHADVKLSHASEAFERSKKQFLELMNIISEKRNQEMSEYLELYTKQSRTNQESVLQILQELSSA